MYIITNNQRFAVIVLGLNLALLIMFTTVQCALQIAFQRMTQVLTVVMISHMCLNLKDNKSLVQKGDDSYDLPVDSLAARDEVHHTVFDAWEVRQRTMSTVVGTLGNDLMHTSIFDY